MLYIDDCYHKNMKSDKTNADRPGLIGLEPGTAQPHNRCVNLLSRTNFRDRKTIKVCKIYSSHVGEISCFRLLGSLVSGYHHFGGLCYLHLQDISMLV
jgi:hypothetical protein